MMKTIRAVGAVVVVSVWAVIALLAWFSPPKEMSDTERRPLAQFPALNGQTIAN